VTVKKPIAGVIVGAIVFFAWGALSWTVIPWHNHVVKTLPEEQLITDTLKTVISEPGFFVFPSMATIGASLDRAAFAERYEKGPTGVLAFSPGGKTWMGPQNYLIALLGAFAISAITMLILCASRARVTAIFPRVLLVTSIGAVVFFAPHLSYWNWFSFPSDFTAIAAADSLAAFFLLGVAQVGFVPKP
jgi:hypothetical protein